MAFCSSKVHAFLNCSASELNIPVVLQNGQSFRWKEVSLLGPLCSKEHIFYIGVACHRVWKLWRQNEDLVGYQVLHKFSSAKGDDKEVLENYFQLHIPLQKMYSFWSKKDIHFKKILAANNRALKGIRVLAQEPLETVFAFICSANNNVKRISKNWSKLSELVEKLCAFYGESALIDLEGYKTGEVYYDFADLQEMVDDENMESRLRKEGFGYRANYLHCAAHKLMKLGGVEWLRSLSSLDYIIAKQKLETLPGVGPKVADCICLMGLGMNSVVPVDTHVWKLTTNFYLPDLNAKKSINKEVYKKVGKVWCETFGDYAGWAHSVLFSTQLRGSTFLLSTEKASRKAKRETTDETVLLNQRGNFLRIKRKQ